MSPTWYIERIPAAGGTHDIRTLDAWGVDSSTITEACWADGGATIVLPSETAGTTAPAWAHMDHLVVWAGNPASGGTRRSHLWVLMPGHHADPKTEAHTMTLVGPWWWLEVTQFFYPLTVSDITTDPDTGAATGCTWHLRHGTEVVWTNWADQSSGTIKGQLHRALWCAIDNDAPIAIGAIDIPGLAPVLEQTGLTCADVIARAARFSPRASQWWDMSGATPIFRAAARASRPSATLALGPDSQTWDIGPRHDLRIDVVRVGYQWDNNGATSAWYDTAGDDTLKDGAHTLRSLVDCPDSSTASNAASHYGIAAQLYAALHSTPYAGTASWWGDAAGVLAVHPGHALNLTGGLAAWATMAAPIASVALTISAAVDDTLTISLGLPPSLGANDLFELFNLGLSLGSGAVSSSGGTREPTPPTDDSTVPGTYDDLNGGTASPPAVALHTQAQGGTCRISGCHPLDGVETCRRWRTQTGSGTIHRYYWLGNEVCAYDPTVHTLRTLSGACHWTGNDDTTVSNALRYVDETGTSHPTAYGVVTLPGEAYSANTTSLVVTATSRTVTGLNNCYTGHNTPADSSRVTGSIAFALSDEDTEDSAYQRMLTLMSPSWATSETAAYSARTTLTYLRQRYRYGYGALSGDSISGVAGFTPWGVYRVTVALQTHPVDASGSLTSGGSWTAYAQRTHDIQADIDGKAKIDWQEEEPPRGYALRAVLVSATPLT